ncbi:MAG TPA: SDR family oxidoreductase [Candidatus Acidoferrum sp.]|nr:SDR family oxidoreductase [Candidatus Acidoferrum sp.]
MILVTGASGSVGREVVREMMKTGKEFRAMFRSKEEAAKAPTRVQTVIADFRDAASLANALRGVEQAFLVCSPIPELVELEGNAIDACRKAGVERIVLNSALGAGDFGKSFPSWHRKVEDKLKASGIESVILRPNGFMQNVVTYLAPSIRVQGVFYDAMGGAKTSYVDVNDVAAVAAKVLTSEGHAGKAYELNGPESITQDELAKRISAATGRPVGHVTVSRDEYRKGLLDAGVPEWMANAELDLQEYFQSGKAAVVDGLVAKLLGRPERTIDQFLSEVADQFREQRANAGG